MKLIKTPKGQIGITVVTSIVFAALWFSYDLPIGIFPALLVPLWIPIFTRQEEPVCPNASRSLMVALETRLKSPAVTGWRGG